MAYNQKRWFCKRFITLLVSCYEQIYFVPGVIKSSKLDKYRKYVRKLEREAVVHILLIFSFFIQKKPHIIKTHTCASGWYMKHRGAQSLGQRRLVSITSSQLVCHCYNNRRGIRSNINESSKHHDLMDMFVETSNHAAQGILVLLTQLIRIISSGLTYPHHHQRKLSKRRNKRRRLRASTVRASTG